jgi:hypothetical protein
MHLSQIESLTLKYANVWYELTPTRFKERMNG